MSWCSVCVLEKRTTLLVPLDFLASSWPFEQWRQILHIRQEEYHDFVSSDVQHAIWFFPCSIAALISFGHMWSFVEDAESSVFVFTKSAILETESLGRSFAAFSRNSDAVACEKVPLELGSRQCGFVVEGTRGA